MLALSISVSTALQAQPPSDAELDDLFSFKGLVYLQDDGGDDAGGNPDIDEDASVYEAIVYLRKRVGERDALTFKLLGEIISAASYDDAKDRAETVSGATGYNPGRFDVGLGWRHRLGAWTVSAQGSYGQEYAYRATGFGASARGVLAEGSTQLVFNFQGYNDVVRVLRYDGTQDPDADRDSYTLDAGLIQTLTPYSLINFGVSHTDQRGFLATAFNSVTIAGEPGVELTPDRRRRTALSLRYRHALGTSAIQPGYSYYWDDWGIEASTAELRYSLRVGEHSYLEPLYRYYVQDAADFYAQDFDAPQPYMTADPDLGDFDGHTVGALLSLRERSFFGYAPGVYDVGVNVYRRSDELLMYWLSFGVNVQ